MNFSGIPRSPTWDELQKGILVLPRNAVPANADPYGSHGVWSDLTVVAWREDNDIWIGVYDRELEDGVTTGTGWRTMRVRSAKQTFMFSYDFATLGGGTGTIDLTAHDGPLPDDFIIQNAFIDVITPLTSGGAATGALTTGQGAGDLVAATAVAGAPWSSTGQKVTIPLLGTIGTWIKTTDERDPALVIATADLTAGAFNLLIEGYVSGS